jgi:hypothetical protein
MNTASVFIAALSFAASALAQAPAPPIDPRAPAAATSQSTTSTPRNPTPSHNQFFSPVMGINIEAQGVALPKGVAEDPLMKPPAEPAAKPEPASTPTATPK